MSAELPKPGPLNNPAIAHAIVEQRRPVTLTCSTCGDAPLGYLDGPEGNGPMVCLVCDFAQPGDDTIETWVGPHHQETA